MSRPVDLLVQDQRLELQPESLEACIRSIDQFPAFPVPAGSLGIAFVDEPECCRLHADFFGDPDPTDVMTFPGDPDDDHAGDIAICPAVAASACRESGLSFASELSLYLVHSWLHLAGLDDRDQPGREEMRKAEAELMQHLGQAGSLLQAQWQDDKPAQDSDAALPSGR